MAVWAKIKNLDTREFLILSRVFLQKPQFILPTYKATRKTMQICNNRFGKKHHKNNRTNAYRHALWNFLISEECYKASGTLEQAVGWSKKITDLHEKLSPNKDLSRKMDLHNNEIGRQLFEKYHSAENIDILQILEEMMQQAIKVETLEEIQAEKNMVFTRNIQD